MHKFDNKYYLKSGRLLLNGLDLLLKTLQVLDEVGVLPLQGGHGASVPAHLVGHRVLLLQDAAKHILAVVEVLVKLPGCLKHLGPANLQQKQSLFFKEQKL